jgi:hypothetical protein
LGAVRTVIRWVGPAVVAVVALAGCAGAGGLHDAGPTAAPSAQPSAVASALWPAADVVASPSPSPTPQAAAQPLPGIDVPGDDIRAVDPRTVLEKDPAVSGDERRALGGCQGCKLYPAQYRDLTGDGRDELLIAVQSDDQRGSLHVYQLRGHGVLPLLALPVQTGFRADTVGHDLEVTEPAGDDTRTVFRWNAQRGTFDRQISASGPGADQGDCLPGKGAGLPGKGLPSAVPSYGGPYPEPAVGAPDTPQPSPTPPASGPSAKLSPEPTKAAR